MFPVINSRLLTPLIVAPFLAVLSSSVWAVPVKGRIVDSNQRPVVGATVRVSIPGDHPSQNLTSGVDGSFSAEVPATPIADFLGSLRVLAPGYAIADFDWKSPAQTFTLTPGQKWGGVVLDETEKPLVGVRVALRRLEVGGASSIYFGDDAPTARTNAKGRWQMTDLPLGGNAGIVIADPRFQAQLFDLPLSKPAPPLFAKVGATVTGRLLSPDKTPIVGAQVSSWSAGVQEVRTDAQGRFTLSGLGPGDARLSSFSVHPSFGKFLKADDFVVLPRKVEALKVGETRDIGDWTAERGILISGRVRDTITKKPVMGAQVWIHDRAASSTSHYTNKDGYFEVRNSGADAPSAYFSDENHLSRRLDSISLPKDATDYELPTVELDPGVSVAGVARLPNGEVTGNEFNLSAKNINRRQQAEVARGGSDGKFSFDALEPGKYTLTVGTPYSGENNLFELVSPMSFVVPPVGQKMVPLKVILKAITSEKGEKASTTLTGRVVDDKGQGVAGAIVSLKNGNYTYPLLAVSGEDGTYELSDLSSNSKLSVVGIERPGFVASVNPPIGREGNLWRVADFVLKKHGARFVGRVLDAQGKPVPGALVAPLELGNIEPVKSAEDGTFVLLDLPAGDFTLIAAKDRLSATQTTSAEAKTTELQLAPPVPFDTAVLLNKWMARGPGFWSEDDFDLGLSVSRMEQLLLKGATDKPVSERVASLLAWFVDTAAHHEPEWTRQNAARLLAKFPEGEDRKAAESSLALVRAASADEGDQRTAHNWLEEEKAQAAGSPSVQSVARYLAMARVAHALKLPEDKSLLDFAAQMADQLSSKTRLSSALKWGEEIAPFGEEAVGNFIEEWEAPTRLALWSGAVRGFAATGDIEAARRSLKTLDALALDPAIKAASAEERGFRDYSTSPDLVVQGAHGAWVRALSERTPATALLESAAIKDDFAHQNALLWVANGARLRGDKATATTALRQVFEFRIGNTEPFALAAWYGAQIEPSLGDELFARALGRLELASSGRFGVGDVAYYLGRRDPARSRVLIEREWSQRAASFGVKNDDPGGDAINSAATKLVRAMLVIDPARAESMAHQLEIAEANVPDPYRARGRERVGWIAALVANEDEAAQARGDLRER